MFYVPCLALSVQFLVALLHEERTINISASLKSMLYARITAKIKLKEKEKQQYFLFKLPKAFRYNNHPQCYH
jgi:hypothetical protein